MIETAKTVDGWMDVFKKKSQDNTVCIMQANAQITNLTIQRRLANAHRLARGERVRDVICKKMVVFCWCLNSLTFINSTLISVCF